MWRPTQDRQGRVIISREGEDARRGSRNEIHISKRTRTLVTTDGDEQSIMVKHSSCLGSNLTSTPDKLCDFGQITNPFYTSVSASENGEDTVTATIP